MWDSDSDFSPEKYEEEAQELWGATPVWGTVHRRTGQYSKDRWIEGHGRGEVHHKGIREGVEGWNQIKFGYGYGFTPSSIDYMSIVGFTNALTLCMLVWGNCMSVIPGSDIITTNTNQGWPIM